MFKLLFISKIYLSDVFFLLQNKKSEPTNKANATRATQLPTVLKLSPYIPDKLILPSHFATANIASKIPTIPSPAIIPAE